MSFVPRLVTPPDEKKLIVDLDDLKLHCKVEEDADDPAVMAFYKAAVGHLDGYGGILGRCLISQQWRLDFPAWPLGRVVELPFPDVSAVTVNYFDTANVSQAVAVADFELGEGALGSFLRFRSGFSKPAAYDDRLDAVQITITAGYGDPEDVPEPIRNAIRVTVSSWYEQRAAGDVPSGALGLIGPYRRRTV